MDQLSRFSAISRAFFIPGILYRDKMITKKERYRVEARQLIAA